MARTYDDRGHLASETRSGGLTSRFEYDERGRLARRVGPDGAAWTMNYDIWGNLAELTDPLGRTAAFTYDAAGRLTERRSPTGLILEHVYEHLHLHQYFHIRSERVVRPDGFEYWELVTDEEWESWTVVESGAERQVIDRIAVKREQIEVLAGTAPGSWTTSSGGDAVTSLLLGMVPLLGDLQGFHEAWSGKDAITGERLTGRERAVSLGLAFVPFVGGSTVRGLLRGADELADAAKVAGPALDDLSRAAAVADRGGLTKAGRALAKHGNRPGSAFPKPSGNPSIISQVGQDTIDDILTTPGTRIMRRQTSRYGEVIEVWAPDGRGIRYDSHGNFMGFLEPGR